MMNSATATITKNSVADLHADLKTWLSTLRVYLEEIMILEHQMEGLLARKAVAADDMAQLEHFQNQCIRETEVIDELRHDVKQHENVLDREPKDRVIPSEHSLDIAHDELRERLITFEKLYTELKDEFTSWSVKYSIG